MTDAIDKLIGDAAARIAAERNVPQPIDVALADESHRTRTLAQAAADATATTIAKGTPCVHAAIHVGRGDAFVRFIGEPSLGASEQLDALREWASEHLLQAGAVLVAVYPVTGETHRVWLHVEDWAKGPRCWLGRVSTEGRARVWNAWERATATQLLSAPSGLAS